MSVADGLRDCRTARDRWEFLLRGAKPELIQRYQEWGRANQAVVKKFLDIAMQMHATHGKGSGWDIVNDIRWRGDIQTTGDQFKISNDFVAMLARDAIAREPSLIEFFELRPMGRHANATKTAAA